MAKKQDKVVAYEVYTYYNNNGHVPGLWEW